MAGDNDLAYKFVKDSLVALFMYAHLFLLSGWRIKRRLVAAAMLAAAVLQAVVLFYCSRQCERPGYDLFRTLLQAIPFLFLFLMSAKGIKRLLPLIASFSLTVVMMTLAVVPELFVPLENWRIPVVILFQLAGLTVTVFLLRSPLTDMMESLGRGWGMIICISTLPVLSFLFVSAFGSSTITTPMGFVPLLGLAVITVTIHVLIFALHRVVKGQYKSEEESRVMVLQLKTTEAQIHKMQDDQREIKILAHDARHYANLIREEILVGDYEDALNVIDLMLHKMDRAGERILVKYCSSVSVNCVLGFYRDMAQEAGIEIDIRVNLQRELPCEEIELAVVIANCLENAVTAARELEEQEKRFITVRLCFMKSQLFLEVQNCCKRELEFHEDGVLPKSMVEGHGLGMVSIDSFVKRYNAVFDCGLVDQVFTLRIIL